MKSAKKTLLYLWKILIVVLINVLVLTMLYMGGDWEMGQKPSLPVSTDLAPSAEVLSRLGSQGEEVRQIQSALKKLGYLNDKVDGIYGQKTQSAVIAFQKDYGLTADGIAGKNTLKALGIGGGGDGGHGGVSQGDLDLLARIISAESRGEPYQGQVAVGAVIMNRIAHPSFPNTLSGVIYQPGAFSCLYDGGINAPVVDSAYKAAREAINGSDPSGGAIYYYNPKKATNEWIFSRPVMTTIGSHRFCS